MHLPPHFQVAPEEEEQKGNFDNPRFKNAINVQYRTIFYRLKFVPPKWVLPGFKHVNEDQTVRATI